jgi:hypothetical protein
MGKEEDKERGEATEQQYVQEKMSINKYVTRSLHRNTGRQVTQSQLFEINAALSNKLGISDMALNKSGNVHIAFSYY